MARTTQRSIQSFTRITKPVSDVVGSRKRKQLVEEESGLKKRKLQLDTPPDTPTKAIKNVLSRLQISVPTPPILKATKRKRTATPEPDTLATSPTYSGAVDDIDDELPEELDDLISLQASFLKALSLHYNHHGSASPVDVRVVMPTTTKVWRKRKVMLADIRLCMGVTYSAPRKDIGTTLLLSNYGNGKICIEMESNTQRRGVLAQAFDESELNRLFSKNLETLWRKWQSKGTVEEFINGLPAAAITECSSYTKLKPSFAKGQRRLDDILGPRSDNADSRQKRCRVETGAIPIKIEEPEPIIPCKRGKENTTPPPTANFRALSLLDRIQKKQDALSLTASSRPTRESLDRLAALQRTEEFVQILEMVSTTKGPGLRASFPLPTLVRSVQSSLRSPMSAEEIERCIGIIGREVAPRYVEVKVVGSMRGVVVNRLFKPDAETVRRMVRAAEGGM